MKKVLSLLVLILLFTACSPDGEENSNLVPSSFEINISELTDRTATITWTQSIDPEGQRVSYTVTLNEEDVLQSSNARTYIFTNLNPNTNYSGKVIASDGTNLAISEFTFSTEEFTPKVHEGYVLLTNQEEVNNFGALGYNVIDGSLGIESRYGPMTDINDLTPLRDLIEVKDYIRIRDSSLESLQGLNHLEKIGANFEITYNTKLLNLHGLEGLLEISGSLAVHTNPELIDLEPLEAVISIGEIYISTNEKLKQIHLLPEAVSVDHLYISDNTSLEIIEGFEKVQNIKYDLEIRGNPKLTDIPAFLELSSVEYGLYINDNNKLENVDFPKLKSVTYGLEIMANSMVTEISGFNELRFVGRQFLLWNNYRLKDFCGLVPFVNQGETVGMFSISGNEYNPSFEEIKAGDCKPG